jgi:nucleoside-diphosphate-sugar epimerase
VYAPSTELLNESSTVAPGNVYAEQKLQGENEIIDVYKGSPERLCIVRVFSVLDWDVSEFTLGGGIKKLALGVPEYELSNADDVRDFLTPKKIAEILIDIVNTPALSGVVNLSTGIGTSVREASRLMVEGSGFDFPLHRVIAGNSSFPFMVGDNSKLRWHLPNLDLSWVPSRWDGKEHP